MNSSNIDRTNSIHRWRVPRALFVIAVALAAFTSASGSPDFTNVIAVNFRPSGTNFDLTVSIPKGLDGASRTGGADLDVRVTLTYSLPRTPSRRSTPDASRLGPVQVSSDQLTIALRQSSLYPARDASSARQRPQPHRDGPGAPGYSLAGQVVVLF